MKIRKYHNIYYRLGRIGKGPHEYNWMEDENIGVDILKEDVLECHNIIEVVTILIHLLVVDTLSTFVLKSFGDFKSTSKLKSVSTNLYSDLMKQIVVNKYIKDVDQIHTLYFVFNGNVEIDKIKDKFLDNLFNYEKGVFLKKIDDDVVLKIKFEEDEFENLNKMNVEFESKGLKEIKNRGMS